MTSRFKKDTCITAILIILVMSLLLTLSLSFIKRQNSKRQARDFYYSKVLEYTHTMNEAASQLSEFDLLDQYISHLDLLSSEIATYTEISYYLNIRDELAEAELFFDSLLYVQQAYYYASYDEPLSEDYMDDSAKVAAFLGQVTSEYATSHVGQSDSLNKHSFSNFTEALNRVLLDTTSDQYLRARDQAQKYIYHIENE